MDRRQMVSIHTCRRCGAKFPYIPQLGFRLCPSCLVDDLRRMNENYDSYSGLAAAIFFQAISDYLGGDEQESSDARSWLIEDGPFYTEFLQLEVDIAAWVQKEYRRVALSVRERRRLSQKRPNISEPLASRS